MDAGQGRIALARTSGRTRARRAGAAVRCLAAASACLLAACAIVGEDATGRAEAVAANAGLRHERIAAGPFQLTAFVRIARPDRPLAVYIEGDGLAWLSRHRPSPDPTPRRAIGLQLAAADPGPNVAYLARPCQFTPMAMNAECKPAYWTGRRFGENVVAAMNDAVDVLAHRVPGQRLDLVGYSGGGAIVVLVAARRTDVASVRTVAGNLDTEFLNRRHGVSPMPDSLNPLHAAGSIAAIPQLHLSGGEDRVVPPDVARRFVAAQGDRTGCCADLVRVVPGMEHDGDWARHWPPPAPAATAQCCATEP